jgi:hypothetical protein
MAALDSLHLEDPWQVSRDIFPQAGSPDEKLCFLLNYAVLAPSILNTQPWKFHIEEGSVKLRADRERMLPVVDPEGREVLLSCGAALFNLCTAMRSFGHAAEMTILPDPHDRNLLAVVTLGAALVPSDLDWQLCDAIPKRRTVRRSFENRPLPQELRDGMCHAADREDAVLSFADSHQAKAQVAELVAEAERIHLADPEFRNELSKWIQERISEARALDSEALVRLRTGGYTPEPRAVSDLFVPIAASVARSFSTGDAAAAHQQAHTEASPAVALLSTRKDTPRDWLAGGQALQRVLLTATLANATSSYLNPPIEVPSLRHRIAAAFGRRDRPQILLRFGYGPEIPPTPRRPVRQVVTRLPPT